MKNRKKISLSIRSNIFIFISVLTLILITILWSLQSIFVSAAFKNAKEKDIERASSLISSPQSASNKDFIADISREYGICIEVLDCSSSFNLIQSSECQRKNCFLHALMSNSSTYMLWLNNAMRSEDLNHTEVIKKDDFDNYALVGIDGDTQDTILSVTLVKNEDDMLVYMVVISSPIEPIGSTIKAFKTMLWIITAFLVLTAITISLILSKKISTPIAQMNNNAKRLARADYDVEFKEQGPSEIRELALTLNHTASELGKLDSMQKELIANISHDLRTPLTMISGYAEIMKDIPSEITPENLQIIVDETSRLTSLVNDLLSVSRLQSGSQKMNIQRVNLTNAVFQTVERYSKFKEHNDFIINFEYEDTVYIMADEIRLLQVIYNLINNAINYTGADRTVTVTQTVENGIVKIAVTDTGEGIKEEDLPLIWDRYYKVDKIHKRAVIGTGLGLSIVKNVLLLHGSRFGVSSELKKGSTFWFEFKIVE